MNSKLAVIIISAVLLNTIANVYAVPERTLNNVCALSFQESGRVLGDGTQNRDGSCVETFMGEIPDVNNMVSSLLIEPEDGEVIEANRNFTIRQHVIGLNAGFFDDPAKEYYQFPQTLDKDGKIQGHSHVVIQLLKSSDNAPDPTVFAFFKGLNDEDDNGVLSVVVGSSDKPGLSVPGLYRLCTMTSSFGHQPTLMPVAQRGSQDDCIRFTIKKDGYKKRSTKKRAIKK